MDIGDGYQHFRVLAGARRVIMDKRYEVIRSHEFRRMRRAAEWALRLDRKRRSHQRH